MRRNKFAVFACLVALIGVTSCSDTDDVITNLPVTAQAEAAIEGVFTDLIEPLSDFLDGAIEAIMAGQPKGPALVCPEMSGTCTSGDATCDEDSSGVSLDFLFDDCNIINAMVVADGSMSVVATGPSSFLVNLVGFSLNGGDLMSGTIEADLQSCGQQWLIDADSALVSASITACGDDYPDQGSVLQMTVWSGNDIWLFSFSFDGGAIASVFGTRNGDPVTQCGFNLDTYQADCSEIGDI